jgi:O-methyltransferase domain/Dimerisation domain
MSDTPSIKSDQLFPRLSSLPGLDAPDPIAFSLQCGLMVTSAVNTAVKLGLADRLDEGPKTIEELARETESHAPSLYLLLRALAGINIFEEVDEQTHTFANTASSRLLRNSEMADLVRLWGAGYQWDAWKNLSYTIQTGRPALETIYGKGTNIWTYLTTISPQEGETFQRGLTVVSNLLIPAILATYNFSDLTHIVDVGGGHGNLCVSLLKAYPELTATLFDRPSIIEHVQKKPIRDEEIASRYSQVAGDFFESVPAGGDCYILKNVMMDWPDQEYLRILECCRQAMDERTGRVLVIEPVISQETPFTKFFSLQMAMMMKAARHRTLEEHRSLFAAAGFHLTRANPLGLEQMLLEGRPSKPYREELAR